MVEYPITDRLRCSYNGRDFSGPAPAGMMLPTAIMKEAADEIERLVAEVERLMGERDTAYAKGKEEALEQVRDFVRVRAERDRYKASLEEIMNNQNDFCTTCDENVDTAALALNRAA